MKEILIRAVLGGALVSIFAIIRRPVETEKLRGTVRNCSFDSLGHAFAGSPRVDDLGKEFLRERNLFC